MKFAQMKDLSKEELTEQITTCEKELFEARFKKSLQQLDNTAQLRTLRHRISQLNTVLRQKELAANA